MNSSRRKLAAFLEALGVPPSARRSAATPAAPACESLEGRQLLSGGLGMSAMGSGFGMGGPADVSNPGFGFDHSNASGFGYSSSLQGGGVSGVGATSSSLPNAGGGMGANFETRMGANFDGGMRGNFGGDFGVQVPSNASVGTSPGAQGLTNPGVGTNFGVQGSSNYGPGGGMGMSTMGQGGQYGVSTAGVGFGQGSSMMPLGRSVRGDYFGLQDSMVPSQGVGTGLGTSSAPTADQTQLQTDVQQLQTDQQAIHDKSQVTPAMEAKVRNDIKTIKGAETTTPDQAAVKTLQTDIKTAQANTGGPTDAQIAQTQADQDAIYKSQGVNAALISQLDADRAAIKTAAGVTTADEATLAADKAAIKADLARVAPTTPTITTSAPTASTTTPVSTASSSTTSTAATSTGSASTSS